MLSTRWNKKRFQVNRVLIFKLKLQISLFRIKFQTLRTKKLSKIKKYHYIALDCQNLDIFFRRLSCLQLNIEVMEQGRAKQKK